MFILLVIKSGATPCACRCVYEGLFGYDEGEYCDHHNCDSYISIDGDDWNHDAVAYDDDDDDGDDNGVARIVL